MEAPRYMINRKDDVAHLGTKVNRRDFLSKLSEENVVRRAFARKISKSKTKSPLAAEPLAKLNLWRFSARNRVAGTRSFSQNSGYFFAPIEGLGV